jgi:uncharacterized membrane protein
MKAFALSMMVLVTLLLIPYMDAHGVIDAEYTIQINADGSAAWTVEQTAGINETYDDLFELQGKLTQLVEEARTQTGREMTVLEETLSSTYTLAGSYVIIEYKFLWQNFSKVENRTITIGDVFQVPDFFNRLYGDGQVRLTYASSYSVATALPRPTKRDESVQLLEWPGTNDFARATIVLNEKSASSGLAEILGQNAALLTGLIILVTGSSTGVYMFRRRNKKERKATKVPQFSDILRTESSEEKVVNLLKASGGSLNQSAITDQCKFSKAKTSQLLATLEDKGVVRRYKKGRDKVVILAGKNNG